jgi:hypothetical protein
MPDITLLKGAIEAITANNLSDAKKHIETFIKQYDKDSLLALWFTPDAIQQHFEDGWDDRFTEWVDNASDEQLRAVGKGCLSMDSLYREFHYVLETEIQWQIDHPDPDPDNGGN